LAVMRLVLDAGIKAYSAGNLYVAWKNGISFATFDENVEKAGRISDKEKPSTFRVPELW
jgi:hypothetical protein